MVGVQAPEVLPSGSDSSLSDTALPERAPRWGVGLRTAPVDLGGLSGLSIPTPNTPTKHGLSQHPPWAAIDTGSCCGAAAQEVLGGCDFTSQDSLQSPREWMKGLDMGVLA